MDRVDGMDIIDGVDGGSAAMGCVGVLGMAAEMSIKRHWLAALIVGGVLLGMGCEDRWDEGLTGMGMFYCAVQSRIETGDNSPRQICREINDRKLLEYIAESIPVSTSELDQMKMEFDRDEEMIYFYYYGTDEAAFEKVREMLVYYLEARLDGHTREYARTCLGPPAEPGEIDDPNVAAVLVKDPRVPADRLTKTAEQVNPDGSRYVYFVLTDGGIAWQYWVICRADGTTGCFVERRDAKEFDPQYQAVIEEVSRGVKAEMEREGIKGLGSCYEFWERKQKQLRKRGIEWKSPEELNPGTLYD